MEAYLKECLGSWTPSVGSQGVKEEALLSLLHDCDYEFDAARRRHALSIEGMHQKCHLKLPPSSSADFVLIFVADGPEIYGK